jgi:tRNA (cmo5U34)-methyltransferase
MKIPQDWTFKRAEVAKGFERHVREQLPWYELATGAVAHIARHYLPEGGLVYDIGASTGNIGKTLAPTLKARKANLIAIDNSSEMAQLYGGANGSSELVIADALDFNFEPFDVAICFLVVMFMPPDRRRTFLQQLASRMRRGGCLIVFDKVTCSSGYLSTVLHRLTIAGKVATRSSPQEIIAKELSLGGVQRPLSEEFLPSIFPNACEVFRFGEFAGWVVEARE